MFPLIDAMWRRFRHGFTLGVRGIVFDPQNRVCLVKHTYTPGWHLPGGGVHPGETMLGAVVRELREEAHVAVRGQPVLHGIFLNARLWNRDHVACYVVRDFEPESGPRRAYEIVARDWFPADALPDGATKATHARLDEVLTGKPAAEYW